MMQKRSAIPISYDAEENSIYDMLVSKDSILDQVERNEYFRLLFGSLYMKLSNVEREVFLLHSQNRNDIEKGICMKMSTVRINGTMQRIRRKAKSIMKQNEAFEKLTV